MLRNVKIKGYIDERMKDRQGRTEITQDKVLKELSKIGYVYFTEPEVDVDDIKTKVHIAELFIPASQRSIYYWLRQARHGSSGE